MNKYINADDLRNAMYHEAFEKESKMQKWESGCWIRYKLFENVLDAMPSADVVEVVRCENCVYGIENGELCGRKVYLCSAMTNPNEFYGDFYCKNGERKETE